MTEKNHACSVCSKRFRSAQGLGDHQRDAHGAPSAVRPRKKATPKAVEPRCLECGELAQLVGGQAIYPHRPDLFGKRFYRCRCGAYCGCHPGTSSALGYPGGPETRRARLAAHGAFDPLWKKKIMNRGAAYAWLADELGIEPDDCHIGMMSAEMARRVVTIVFLRAPEAAAA